jgi:hypothetical protein
VVVLELGRKVADGKEGNEQRSISINPLVVSSLSLGQICMKLLSLPLRLRKSENYLTENYLTE